MAIGTKITTAGAILLAKALGGKELKFTRGAFGDAMNNGAMVTPSSSQRDALTTLINERMSLPISNFVIEDDQVIVTLSIKNDNVKEDFRIAEMGLFAEDPDTHAEKLYAYAFEGEDGDKMHAHQSDVVIEHSAEVVTKIATAANVTAIRTYSHEGIEGVSVEDFQAHINSADPHPNLKSANVYAGTGLIKTADTLQAAVASDTQLGAVKVGAGLYMTSDLLNVNVATATKLGAIKIGDGFHMDNDSLTADAASSTKLGMIKIGDGFHMDNDSLTADAASSTKLGMIKVGRNLYMENDSLNAAAAGGEGDNPLLSSRLQQLEINQANMFILLDSQFNLGVQSSLMLIEDFLGASRTDTYSVNAYSVTPNNYVRVFEPGTLRVGGFYTLTDGLLKNEVVQVTALSKGGNYDTPYLATLAEPSEGTYTKSDKLLRSTVTLDEGKAYGAGLIRSRRVKKASTWQGNRTTQAKTLDLVTTPANASSFDLSGEYLLTSDGFFTLE